MAEQTELNDLIAHLACSSRLTAAEAARLLDDVLAFLDETPESFIRRRHQALQAQGMANEAIFAQLLLELGSRRFRAPAYSARQLRRIVYG